jgi:hypothetical protein
LAQLVGNGLESRQERGILQEDLMMEKFQHGMDAAGQSDGKGRSRMEPRSLGQCRSREIGVTGYV